MTESTPAGPAIVAEHLTRRFGQVTAVANVNLQIPTAQIYGFLGPNGSGKSTTIRMLCGLLKPSDGRVHVLGHEVPRDAEALRMHIGYMSQQFSLYKDLSVAENLEFMAKIQGLDRRARRTRIDECLTRYDLGRLLTQRAGSLSGGERQRLALACAILHRPALLLLDEPTSAVDPQTRRDFWESLFELIDQGTTILVSTHYMDEAERCHRLCILDHGRVVGEGEPQQLIDDIDAHVVEISNGDLRRVRRALEGSAGVRSIAQLGSRLHVLMDHRTTDPVASAREALGGEHEHVAINVVRAGLEDVFVAATGAATEAAD